MNEQELNDAIKELCAQWADGDPFELPWEAKPIPYIGWFWRYVHFDSELWEPHSLGIIPRGTSDICTDRLDEHLVGFMENNKWDYPEFDVPNEQWQKLRACIVECVTNPSAETCQAVYDYMQSLCPIK